MMIIQSILSCTEFVHGYYPGAGPACSEVSKIGAWDELGSSRRGGKGCIWDGELVIPVRGRGQTGREGKTWGFEWNGMDGRLRMTGGIDRRWQQSDLHCI